MVKSVKILINQTLVEVDHVRPPHHLYTIVLWIQTVSNLVVSILGRMIPQCGQRVQCGSIMLPSAPEINQSINQYWMAPFQQMLFTMMVNIHEKSE